MKSDTERKLYYNEKLHRRKGRLHAHLSKDLRGKLKTKKRAVLLHKNDRVKIMRGPEKGKEARVIRVSTLRRKVFLEGITVKNRRGKEMLLALEPSNLLITSIEQTKERQEIFRDDAFRKEEKKAEPKHEQKPAGSPQPAAGSQHAAQGGQKPEGGHEHAHEHKAEGAKPETHVHEHKAESKPPPHTTLKPSTR